MSTQQHITDRDGDTLTLMHHRNGDLYVMARQQDDTATIGPLTRDQLADALDAVAPAGHSTGPDETTGEALARLQATMARLLDEADAELRDEADGGIAAALIEKEAEEPSVDYHAMWWQAERERGTAERKRNDYEEAWQAAERAVLDERAMREAAEDRAVLAEARLAEAQEERDEARKWLRETEASLDEANGVVKSLRAAEPRPLTPGGFQALVQESELAIARRIRALDPTGRFQPSSLRLVDAIYRGIRDSQRPEGAEEIERLLTEDLGDFRPPVTPEAIADLLAVRGVRVVSEDGAA